MRKTFRFKKIEKRRHPKRQGSSKVGIILNDAQKEFCNSRELCIRLLAPAGCGKTASLLYRCLHLLRRAHDSLPRFLIVTFTKTATVELLDRLNGDPDFEELRGRTNITTLNAYGWRRIRSRVTSPRLLSTPTDRYFALRNQLHPVWQKNRYVEEVVGKRGNAPRALMQVMDSLKSMGFNHQAQTNFEHFDQHMDELESQGLKWHVDEQYELLASIGILDGLHALPTSVRDRNRRQFYNRFFKFWRASTRRLLEESTFTFEDQKYWCYLDLADANADKAAPVLSGATRYDHIFVDEFQDINPLDLALIKELIVRNRATITIVGDDDQAIFEWRGATPEYILHPQRYFGTKFKDYQLDVNYRSPRNIVNLSQKLIGHNDNRVEKQVKSNNPSVEAEIEVVRTDDIGDRLHLVSEIVEDTQYPGRVAVIGRLRRQLIPYQVYFAGDGAPFSTAVDLDVFSSAGFDGLVNLLDVWSKSGTRQGTNRIVQDVLSVCDLIRRRPLGRADRGNLTKYLTRVRPANIASGADALKNYNGPKLSGRTHEELHHAATSFLHKGDAPEALRVIGKEFAGLRFDAEKAEEDVFYTDPPLEQLASIAESHELAAEDLIERIDTVKLHVQEYRDLDSIGEPNGSHVLGRPLHLMTATRAKGKEFDTVILLDTVQGIWPHNRAVHAHEVEAERRLFYVAFTRAMNRVVLLCSTDSGIRSQFLDELSV